MYIKAQTQSYTHLYIEHICNSRAVQWDSWKKAKEKRMTESEQY
jgi:hypothetical protein